MNAARRLVQAVWTDLRERRLWPVALALALALVLAPVLLLERPEETQSAHAPPPPVVSPVTLVSAAKLVAEGSELDVFTPGDPFRRPRAGSSRSADRRGASSRPSSPPASDPTGAGNGASETPSAANPDGSAATGSSPNAPSSGAGSSAGDSSGRGTGSSGSSGSGTDSASPGGEPAAAERSRRYTDVVDVRFGERGEERTRSEVSRMTALPADDRAVVTFLGPSVSGRSAVFLLGADPLEQAGDGACDPSPSDCRLLALRLDRDHDQHFFTDAQGRKYSLRLLAIDRIPVSEALERAAGSRGRRQ